MVYYNMNKYYESRLCKNCDNTFTVRKRKKQKYCSQKCSKAGSLLSVDKIIEKINGTGYTLLSDPSTYKGWRTKFEFKCPLGHIYTTEWYNFSQGCRCPICQGKRVNEIKLEDALITCGYTLLERADHTKKLSTFKCNNGHTYKARLNDFNMGHRCPNCSGYISKGETEVLEFIKSIYSGNIISNSQKLIYPLELDIYLPDFHLAIEYCGLYYHSELNGRKDRNYHLNKYKKCKDKNVHLIQIFEDEWLNKKSICKSRLKSFFNLNEKIYARKTECKTVDKIIANGFMHENHLQGPHKTNIAYGLYYNDELISVMTFCHPCVAKGGNSHSKNMEIDRFCSKLGVSIIGGASKLFKRYLTDNDPECVISYCDIRWGNGSVYSNMGMTLEHQSKPNYWYLKKSEGFSKRYHRYSYRKQQLLKEYNHPEMTENQLAVHLGMDRIYDCGNLKFTYIK